MKTLAAIERLKQGDYSVLKHEPWLKYLALAAERNINLERVASLEEAKQNYVLLYVEKTLRLLQEFAGDPSDQALIEEVLAWSEVSKGGLVHQRQLWAEQGYNLFAHNIGSAQIYQAYAAARRQENATAAILIQTHGLIGQYIRGEVALDGCQPLYQLIEDGVYSAAGLKKLLLLLNHCVIAAVSDTLWTDIRVEVEAVIEQIAVGDFTRQYPLAERLRRLRTVAISSGENFTAEYAGLFANTAIAADIYRLFAQADLWFVEAALYDFSFTEFIKIFLLIVREVNGRPVENISFEPLMKDLYYQYEGKKRINIYKKRIIERYLAELSPDDILQDRNQSNPHVNPLIAYPPGSPDTVLFRFAFSPAGGKLIEFCTEAEKSDVLYESAIVLLFDLFHLRKDKYDRFYEEESYLQTMNQTIDYKKVILDYATGGHIVDIGPGGGALMDLIAATFPAKQVTGVDISQNVLDALKKKKQLENSNWDVRFGDALHLAQYIDKGSVDTIVFCSILHELFSYIEYEGKKFNYATLEQALRSAYEVLAPGGRIIIRDGIMTAPKTENRIIRFLSAEGMEFLKRYAGDFQGRDIQYRIVGRNEVLMPVNDAMEFLYTYTWGEKSYVHEVNEQFGYFTPGEYAQFIARVLGEEAKIIEARHFLQEGYTLALSPKIALLDENGVPTPLPDSTCLIVIEKQPLPSPPSPLPPRDHV